MPANATFLVANHANALLLPNAALSWKPADYVPPKRPRGQAADPTMLTVFRLTAGAPEAVRVKIGASDQDNSEIVRGGLKAGDLMIVGDTSKDKKGGGFGPPGTGGNPNGKK